MKNALPIILIFLIGLTSCEKFKSDSDLIFKIGDDTEYSYRDFELYDSSTHMLYFKTIHPEFDDNKQSSFAFYIAGDKIFQGSFWPAYLSSLPTGPYIWSFPFFYQYYALRFEFLGLNGPDPRNDSRLINGFKNHNLLHSGLSVIINAVEIHNTQLTFSFTVTNRDQSNLLILDPDKIGPNLFHYFTNGLSIRKLTYEEVFSSNIEPQTPSPWNSWKIDWLSELKSGDSRQFKINYTIESPINPGVYKALFEFPGLAFQVTKDQLYQNNKRIWLGDIQVTKEITVQ